MFLHLLLLAETLGAVHSGKPLQKLLVPALLTAPQPQLRHLGELHAVEGIGDVSTHAIRQDDTVVVGVQLTSPVQAMFAVTFSYALHRDFLNEVADAESLIFATTDTGSAHEDRPLWLSVDIDGAALRQTMSID